jgi:4-hydroxybenzoate polyprenyltransferase
MAGQGALGGKDMRGGTAPSSGSSGTPSGGRPSRFRLYWQLTRMHRPIGTLLLLWPTLWALIAASDGRPPTYLLFAFVLGTLLMRSAGCAINDYADRDFDLHVARTRARPLTTGQIEPWEAIAVFVGLALLAGLLILPMNPLVWKLAVVAVFLAVSYPFMKRFFALPQAYLGIAFGFGIPMAYAAVLGAVPSAAWLMLAANIAWALAYDTEYAMVDREDDLKLGLRTAAITFGRFDVLCVMLCYALALALLAAAGLAEGFRGWYWLGLAVAAVIAVYHFALIRERTREGCFRAFNHNNWFGAAVFAGVAGEYWLP